MAELDVLPRLPLISLSILLPLFTAIFIIICVNLKDKTLNFTYAGYISVFGSILTMLSCVVMFLYFDQDKEGFQFQENYVWLESVGLNLHFGIDGISLLLIMLSSLLFLIAIIASLNHTKKYIKEYLVSFLALESLSIGLFSSLNLLLFFFFFEAMLIPMFLIIGIWGGEKKVYAAFKFFLYTFCGSIFFLAGIIIIYNLGYGFEINILSEKLPLIDNTTQIICWTCLVLAFAIKIPMWPFHTWLPDAHVQAPTSGSVILAGILLKIGAYGFLRIILPCFPVISEQYASYIMILSIIALIHASLVALAQSNMKKMIAYSSVAHMGYVTSGIFSMNIVGISGAIFQMISHGLISAALFLVVGFIYERLYSKEIEDCGAIASYMPKLAFLFMIFVLGSIGLPGTTGFTGEFLSLLGVANYNYIYMIFLASGVVLGPVYMLGLYKNTMLGIVTNKNVKGLQDINITEYIALLPLAVLVIILGVYPNLMLGYINVASTTIIKIIELHTG